MFDGERGMALESMQGKRASSRVDLGSMELLRNAGVTSGSLSTCDSDLRTVSTSIKQVEAPDMFQGAHGIALHAVQGNRASSRLEGEVPGCFPICGGDLWDIFELWWGWPFKRRVCSATWGLQSNNKGSPQESLRGLAGQKGRFSR